MKFRLFILFFAISLSALAQKTPDSIPQSVLRAFTKEYPDSKKVSWEKSGTNYLANTKVDGQNAKALFSTGGEWVETNFETSESELPGKISNYLSANYAGYETNLSRYTESKNNGAYYYITIRKKGTAETAGEMFFDSQGVFIKKNDFIPITANISTSSAQEIVRKAKEEAEKKEYDERRAALLAMDRTISESEMPAKVKSNFNKKFPKAVISKWDSLDNAYTAHFTMEEQPVKADFGLNADWLATYENVTGQSIDRTVDQYIETNYPSLKIKFAEKLSRRDKNNTFYVELAHKAKKGETPLLTKLTFDKNGKLIKEEEPPKQAIAEEETGTPAVKEGPDRFEQKMAKEGETQAEVSADAVIDASELPSPIINYVANFKGYKIYKAYFGDHPEGENTYKVEARKEGVAQKGYQMFFDNQGKYLSGDEPPVSKKVAKAEAAAAQEENVSVGTPVASRAPVAKKSKGKNAYVDPGDIDEVPDNVKKNFSRKYPKAADAFWTVDEQKFTVEFTMNEIKNTVLFGADGKDQVTRTEMDADLLMSPIKRYIEDKYKGYKIRYVEKVTRKDRKNHFYIEIYSKKRNANPGEAQLYFDTSGRLMQNPPE
ncbi:MAG: PepSY-like domain-containing protein [Bacteroidota bacterium]